MSKHPMQPVEIPEDGTIRFKDNKIVRFLLDAGDIDMNKLATIPFSDEDRMQFAQLIGYSVSGYGELSYASEESIEGADKIARSMSDEPKKATT